ncbi:KICSTOR subunit 2-like [Diorhabda carinulata]|uniref:KICSTOR subunit 2-like n=1 Tax=Diorhabda carinulata TaxID=1163345 RepID=UPI0025A11C17|nr:KICSTOR subunit 2-like [Diorhabda carinulata]
MESEDEFLHTYFTHVSQLCYEKAREHLEKEKGLKGPVTQWGAFLNLLQQLALAEKSYMEIGFLQNKHKSFLRKDNSLRSVYDNMKNDLKRLEDNSKQPSIHSSIQKGIKNLTQFVTARINLIDLYEKIYNLGVSKQVRYTEILSQIHSVIERHSDGFIDISFIPIKAVFSLECEILEQLFEALVQLQKLEFLSPLASIHGAHTRLAVWETKMQSREIWKLGIFKNNPLPSLFQWLQKLKGSILSKFSLYFHDILAEQTTPNDMRILCSKLYNDHYQKIVSFQKKSDAAYVLLIHDMTNVSNPTHNRIIVSYPQRIFLETDIMLKMISETNNELQTTDKIIYKFVSQEQCTYILTMIEPMIYLIILFENKKSEKDAFISNFVLEFCQNLRCTKLFTSLKNTNK